MANENDDVTPAPITEAIRRVYGAREPDYGWQTTQRWGDGGPDPLDQILVFAQAEPVEHWHYIGIGLTSEVADGDDGRGWTFELTVRLTRAPDEATPPVFMANVLQNLARYVAESGNAFGPGHTIDMHGPIQLGSTTPVSHVLFAEDPQLGFVDRTVESSQGDAVDFLQVVGLTSDEAAAKKTWTADGFTSLYAEHYPLLVTRLDRASLLLDPQALSALEVGRSRDGSSTAGLAVEELRVRDTTSVADRMRRRRREITVTIGAGAVDGVCLLLPLRLAFGRTLELDGPHSSVTFTPNLDAASHQHGSDGWVIGLSSVQVQTISGHLLPRRGTYQWDELPGLVFVVEPTIVRDDAGDVVATIG